MIQEGDIVVVTDGSYSVRLDKYEGKNETFINFGDRIGMKYEVILIDYNYGSIRRNELNIHNIHIKSLSDNSIFLHSAAFVRKVDEIKRCKNCGERI